MGKKNFLRKIAKFIPQAIGTVGGAYLGGPAGAAIGGGLGRAVTRGGHNKFKGLMQGAGHGLMYSAMAPTAVSSFGGSPFGFLGKMAGANHPSLLHQLGVANAPGFGGGLGLLGNFGQEGLLSNAFGGKGLLSNAMSGKSPLNKFFGGAFGGGQSQAASPQGGYESEAFNYDPMGYQSGVVNAVGPHPVSHQEAQVAHRRNSRISAIVNNPNMSMFEKMMQIYQILEQDNPGARATQQAQNIQASQVGRQGFSQGQVQQFKRGGYIEGISGGQDDDVFTKIPEKSFVVDSTTVSLLGDGNSLNGKKKLEQMEDKLLRSNFVRDFPVSQNVRLIDARVSPSEYVFKPQSVAALGKGDNAKGAKMMNNMRKNLRSHKGVNKFLPPKSKPVEKYFRGSRVH